MRLEKECVHVLVHESKYKQTKALAESEMLSLQVFSYSDKLDFSKSILKHIEIFWQYGTDYNLTSELIMQMNHLKWSHTAYTGVGWIISNNNLERFLRDRVIITNSKGINSYSVAEWVISVLLWHVKKIRALEYQQNKKDWRPFCMGTLKCSNVVILGLGSIGQEIARKLSVFDANLIGVSFHGKANPEFLRVYTSKELYRALSGSDYLIICLPRTIQTEHIISDNELALLKKGAFVVNVGRGSCINELSLINAIKKGYISGAALDVFEKEPLPRKSKLWKMDKVLISPHIAWSSPFVEDECDELFFRNLRNFMNGLPLLNQVNLKLGY
jgi:phosphoglycerate dehydrogenase-like enzyme